MVYVLEGSNVGSVNFQMLRFFFFVCIVLRFCYSICYQAFPVLLYLSIL